MFSFLRSTVQDRDTTKSLPQLKRGPTTFFVKILPTEKRKHKC